MQQMIQWLSAYRNVRLTFHQHLATASTQRQGGFGHALSVTQIASNKDWAPNHCQHASLMSDHQMVLKLHFFAVRRESKVCG
jgi:hypothetical protein